MKIPRVFFNMLGYFIMIFAVAHLILFILILLELYGVLLGRGKVIIDFVFQVGVSGPYIWGGVLFFIGIILVEGKKRSVLFLRPFNSYSNNLVVPSFQKKMGRNISIIALDDGEIPSPKYSFLEYLIAIFFLVPFGVLSAFVIPIDDVNLIVLDFKSVFVGLLLFAAVELLLNGAGILFLIPVGILSAFIISIGIDSPTGIYIKSFVVFFLFIYSIRLFWDGVQIIFNTKKNKFEISDSGQLNSAIRSVKRLSYPLPRVFNPRSVVFKSSHKMWKKAVAKICNNSDFALIDISKRSESIEWEINFLKKNKKGRFLVLIDENKISEEIKIEFGDSLILYNRSNLITYGKSNVTKLEEQLNKRLEILIKEGT